MANRFWRTVRRQAQTLLSRPTTLLTTAAVGGGLATLAYYTTPSHSSLSFPRTSFFRQYESDTSSSPSPSPSPPPPPTPRPRLQPTFRSMAAYKVYNMDFQELLRPEVGIELAMVAVPLIIGAVVSVRLRMRTRREWRKRHFLHVANVSLNTVQRLGPQRYSLSFRTLMERELNLLISNPEGVAQLGAAARRATEEEPLVVLDTFEAHWTLCNQIANQVSALCAPAFLHRDISRGGVASARYLMALTCEQELKAKNRKIRVMLVRRDTIDELLADLGQDEQWRAAKLESPSHRYRWQLLQKIALAYEKQPRTREGHLRWGRPLCELELVAIDQPSAVIKRDDEEFRDGGSFGYGPAGGVIGEGAVEVEVVEEVGEQPHGEIEIKEHERIVPKEAGDLWYARKMVVKADPEKESDNENEAGGSDRIKKENE